MLGWLSPCMMATSLRMLARCERGQVEVQGAVQVGVRTSFDKCWCLVSKPIGVRPGKGQNLHQSPSASSSAQPLHRHACPSVPEEQRGSSESGGGR